jgi:hypothetical protein
MFITPYATMTRTGSGAVEEDLSEKGSAWEMAIESLLPEPDLG